MAEQITEEMKKCEQAYNQALSNNEIEKAIELCEKLVFEYDWFGYKMNLPELYNKAGKYDKTISFVQSVIDDPELGMGAVLYLMPWVITQQGIAFKNLKEYNKAIPLFKMVAESTFKQLNDFPNASDIEEKKTMIAINFAYIGEVYFKQKNYQSAYKFFRKAGDYRTLISSVYHIALMCYKGLGMEKDVEGAVIGFDRIPEDPSQGDFSNEEVMCITNTNYYLGLIYATELGFEDKEKAIKRLKKAQSLGYSISDTEINELTENIIDKKTTGVSQDSSSGGCYVATCVYGSYDCPPVWTLRRFRDDILAHNVFGRLFIRFYYATSPTAVRLFGKQKWFHKLFKTPLDKFVKKLQENGVENTPYND